MSRVEFLTGKIKKIESDLCLEDLCKSICEKEGYEMASYNDSWKEQLLVSGFDNNSYVVTKNDVYQILKYEEKEDDEDIFDAKENEDGTIDFTLKFYNGGCCFEEALEIALNRK